MSFDPNPDNEISFEQGAELTSNYRKTIPTGGRLGGYFNGEEIQRLLTQDGAVGIRIYYGLQDNGSKELVIVGVDEEGNDLIGSNYLCMDMFAPCPPTCSNSNILNSD